MAKASRYGKASKKKVHVCLTAYETPCTFVPIGLKICKMFAIFVASTTQNISHTIHEKHLDKS